LDDEQLLGLVALLEDDVAGFVGADRGASAGQQTEINGLSAIAIPRPLLVRLMIQAHDGGLLQPYDNGSAGFGVGGQARRPAKNANGHERGGARTSGVTRRICGRPATEPGKASTSLSTQIGAVSLLCKMPY